MEAHNDVHWADYPQQFPCFGEITDVYPKDHANNPTGAVTLYQVRVTLSRPTMTSVLAGGVMYLGQSAGWGVEKETPLVKGQRVLVTFVEGNPQRPIILGAVPYVGPQNTPTIAQTSAQHPQAGEVINGTSCTIDKDGNATIQLAENKELSIKDSGGGIIFKLAWTGAAYEVWLGGTSSIKALVTEDLVAAFNTHVHTETGGTTSAPINSLSGVTTTVVKAK